MTGGQRSRRRHWRWHWHWHWRWRRVRVTGGSMAPTLREGDQVLVCLGAPPRAGAVVLVELPGGRGLGLKRAAYRCGEQGWWLLGDAAAASTDSRHFGAVPTGSILGRVVLRYWPSPGFPARRASSA